ncbi:hypothetical protein BDA96_06G121700 [Sorghum bicolor]|uniref:Uncharacterized protein n=2 Tax=Sorghum bicolor TaxID=4558 RepID=A0A921QT28_SORBI|nr:hypothetical protein BDA96_06G121700 [Sorghum bicolor]KXG26490.1 hypothetical protein SORBI_3006G110000 [Sorghum bicolor]
MCAAARPATSDEMCPSIIPHHVMRGEASSSASHPPPPTSKMQSCCPKLLGPSAAMIASPPPQESRLHLLPRGRGRRSYSP